MSPLNLDTFNKWIGDDLIATIHNQRIEHGEIKRKRKLGTSELLWVFLTIALYSSTKSLHEIIKLALTDLNKNWRISVWGFCKARLRFSPQTSVSDLGAACPKT